MKKILSLLAILMMATTSWAQTAAEDDVKIEKITINYDKTTVEVGGTLSLDFDYQPDNATNPKATVTSSNPEVAEITSSFRSFFSVKGIKVGTTEITVTAQDGGGAKDSFILTVTEATTEGGGGDDPFNPGGNDPINPGGNDPSDITEEDENAPKKIYVPNYIDKDFTDQDISVENIDWEYSSELDEFLHNLIPEAPKGVQFKLNEIIKDFKGYTHIKYNQLTSYLYSIDGREVVLHIKDGKLKYITGDLSLTEPDDSQMQGEMQNAKVRNVSGNADTKENVKRYTSTPCNGTPVNCKADGYFYKYSNMLNKDVNVVQREDGKYVLQDPKRKLYTVDFGTQAVREKNQEAKAQGKEHMDLFNLTMTEILALADDFTSDNPDFTNHDCNESKLTSISLSSPLFADATGDFDIAILEEDGDNVKVLYEGKAQLMPAEMVEGTEANRRKVSEEYDEMPEGEEMGDNIPTIICPIEKGKEPVFNASYRDVDTENKYYHNNWKLRVSKDGNVMGECYMCKSHSDEELECSFGGSKAMLRKTAELVKCQSAIDIHYSMACTLDAFKKAFDYDGYDGKGAATVSLVNYGGSENASAGVTVPVERTSDEYPVDERKAITMNFGLGITIPQYDMSIHPYGDVETCGHEFTHKVANILDDKNESGALSESYADIMGKMAERMALKEYSIKVDDYLVEYVGWDCSSIVSGNDKVKPVRSFSNPAICEHPSYYKGQYWQKYDENGQDDGGVHVNCGVQNHWFYLLCTGGEKDTETGEKVSITPISRENAEAITFLSLRYFAFPHLDYPTARKNSIRVAEMYFGKDSQELKSVHEAWYAVGVGTDEWQPGMPLSVDAIHNVPMANTEVRKIIKNGQIVIVKNGTEYSTTGIKLK